MVKRGVDGGNAHTGIVLARPVAKAARKQVAAASVYMFVHRFVDQFTDQFIPCDMPVSVAQCFIASLLVEL